MLQADTLKTQLAARGVSVQPGAAIPGDQDGRQMLMHWRNLTSMVAADQEDTQALAASQAKYLAVALENYHRSAPTSLESCGQLVMPTALVQVHDAGSVPPTPHRWVLLGMCQC